MEPMLLRAEDVQQALGLCRSKVYEMMASGELPTVRVGRAVRVPADRLRLWISSKIGDDERRRPLGAAPNE